jgi:Kef-type K+ transport system membrane component KefB
MFIVNLLMVLVAAFLGRSVSKKLKQPVILGELLFGMILGNLHIIRLSGTMEDIADIGIVFLLFSAGLTINIDEFRRLGRSSSVVAVFGVIIPFVLGYVVAVLFGFSHLIALFVAVSLIATSVGVKTEVLAEFKMMETRIGTLIIGAAVIDDILAVIAIGIVAGVATSGDIPVKGMLVTILLSAVFLLASLTVLINLFKRFSRKYGFRMGDIEDILILGFIILLIFSFITEEIGLSIITGAFIAGLILGQTTFSSVLFDNISLFGESLFIPVFFVTMGMQFDLGAITSVGVFAVVLLIAAIMGKVIGCGLGAKISRFTGRESFAIGVAMIPRAGVELVLIKLGLDYAIISSEIASVILCMVIVTTLMTPPLLSTVLKRLKLRT